MVEKGRREENVVYYSTLRLYSTIVRLYEVRTGDGERAVGTVHRMIECTPNVPRHISKR